MGKQRVKKYLGLVLLGAVVVNIAYVLFFRQKLGEKTYMLLYILVQACFFLAPMGCVLFEVRKWLQEKGYEFIGDLINITFYGVILISVIAIVIN